nr:hypothetical protein [Tanacetum cinerariifolium]
YIYCLYIRGGSRTSVGLSARVESSAEEQSLGEDDASKQGRNIAEIDADVEITLVDETTEDRERYNDQEMFDTDVFNDKELKNKSFDEVQKAFEKTMSWINSFVPMDFEVVKDKAVLMQESSSKRPGDKLDQERSKKQKVEDDKESEELKRCWKIIPHDGDDVTIDATPLSIKTSIIDYKIYKEGKKSYFLIFRADGNS